MVLRQKVRNVRFPQPACAGHVEKRGREGKEVKITGKGKHPADERLYLKVKSQR